jgi:cellulose synthase/poly-beta-1,6-N-acetylglucosamine synthase-like glycosyltransferase
VMSMLAQDYSGTLEVIAVNDRSTDRTGEILDELTTGQLGLIRQCPGNAIAPRNGQLVAVCANRPRFDFRQVGRLWQLAFEGHFFFARSSILVELLLGNDYGVVVSCLGCDVEPDSSLASAHTRERAGADPLISR